ncbi:hormogonium polysaccharide biosynthesis protein HpsA [Leptolyngbyaceae cyanobacterium UHCC 1019]
MSDRKLAKKLQPILKQVWKLSRRLTKSMVTWLLRTVFLLNRRPRVAGFVLPTTVFLILVVSLTVGALTFRSFNSTSRTIANVQSRQIYNAATPAIDRARAKLDYLFGKDARLPSGTPSEEFIISMLLNEAHRPIGEAATDVDPLTTAENPYKLDDETRIDINDDGELDNAWVYQEGPPDDRKAIVYSINFSTPDATAVNEIGPVALLTLDDQEKAKGNNDGPYVRSGPQSNSSAVKCRTKGGGSKVEGGWFQDVSNTSILRKRFQIDAFVVNQKAVQNGNPVNFTTLEFLQDYKLDRGNKWGAWFKYDLEAVSGAPMNWNGAMHSEGNIFIGRDDGGIFNSFLISATKSCLFKPESNSEISVREFAIDPADPLRVNGGVAFKGIIAGGELGRNTEYKSAQRVDKYNGGTYNQDQITPAKDWATGSKDVIGISTDPVKLLTEDIHQATKPDITNTGAIIDPIRPTDFNPGRFVSDPLSTQPYVDDLYRADNRYGPKVRYSAAIKIPTGTPVGTNITAPPELINDPPTSGVVPGLDGYWERRTFKDSDTSTSKVYTGGMRILVGERLELGNPYGWIAPQNRPDAVPTTTLDQKVPYPEGAGNETGNVSNLKTVAYAPTNNVATADAAKSDVEGDPLYPAYTYTGTANASRKHETKQRRALRDNLAAVQAAAIYHYRLGETADGRTPAACLALTAHPGSPYTLRQSVNFKPYRFNGGTETLYTDFFYGKGTNGWEFEPPTVAQLQGGGLRQALLNLANFAGDPDGAFPPKQEPGLIHPDPIVTMWGNFSNLRRALTAGNNSPADQSYLETAGCTMGMLAYNINQVQKFNPSAASNQTALDSLGRKLFGMMNGNIGDTDGEVISDKKLLATYNYDDSVATPDLTKYNPRDYDRVTPDMFLAALLKDIRADSASADVENDPQYQLAVLIHEHFQIRRDRTYGFRPSPAANTWNYNPYILEMPGTAGGNVVGLWSSACDPNIFKVSNTPAGSSAASAPSLAATGGAVGREARSRLALSRLCGEVIPAGNLQDLKTSLGDNNYPALGDPANNTNLPAPAQTYYPTLTNSETVNADFVTPALRTAVGTNNNWKRATVAPKFPSLYYIFPEVTHDHLGDLPAGGADYRQPGNPKLYTGGTALPIAYQPWKEPYITRFNTGYSYEPVNATQAPAGTAYSIDYTTIPAKLPSGAANPGAIVSFTYNPFLLPIEDNSVQAAALVPKLTTTNWVLPTIATPAAADPNPNRIVTPDGTIAAIPFQDKVLFNGREWLPTRALDIDLNMLRNTAIDDDTWLPVSGIVYAFREDAVREDAIARPAGTLAYTDAQTPGAETDPALNAAFNVSTKPVDFIADPDRRPHGFRLRNGAVLKRGGAVDKADNFRGLSFISDQPVYIMGNFNLHQDKTTNAPLEEFQLPLPTDPTQYSSATFYDNRDASQPEPKFADPDEDLWRPSEILADSVSILSDRFCDGSAIDTFMTANPRPNANEGGIDDTTSSGSTNTSKVYTNGTKKGAEVYNDTDKALFGSAAGCLNDAAAGATSFLNQNRPSKDLTNASGWNWVRENPGDPIYSPVKISRNGNGLIASATSVPVEYSSANDTVIQGEYMDNKNSSNSGARTLQRIPPNQETGVNVIMVSGIVPARQFQGYGALSNFPRFLENWDDGASRLRFSGSFLQLNFSNYATGPFDDDSWEPGETPITGREVLPYRPPARLWGYDVGLQLAQASPAATRFTSLSKEKNEFYEEPSGSDAYMKNLCIALKNQPPTGFNAASLNCPT